MPGIWIADSIVFCTSCDSHAIAEVVLCILSPGSGLRKTTAVMSATVADPDRLRDNTTVLYVHALREFCRGSMRCLLGSYSPSMGLRPAGVYG
eukprot:gene7555-31456_t